MTEIKTIGLVAPSGVIRDFGELNKKIEILSENFKVKKFYSENSSNGYLSDTDEARARYFEDAFIDSEIDLVLSVRGGYGALRMVDKINWEVIRDKIYLGSSDATILLCALNQKTNVKCYHSLMMTNGFVENLKRNIEIIQNDVFDIKLKRLSEGSATGALWGGNLSSLVSMLSKNEFLPKEDIILFVEDLNEPCYKLDKMLYELYRCDELKNKIKGIIFGDFYLDKKEIMPLLKEFSLLFNLPCWISEDITHKISNVTLPFGKVVRVN